MSNYLIIPVHDGSTRFPGKFLAPINGVPMVAMVYRAVRSAAGFDRVIVLTDSQKILFECQGRGVDCVYQDAYAECGTERIAYYAITHLDDDDLVVNVQGDEPLMDKRIPEAMLERMQKAPGWVWTAARKVRDTHDMTSQDVVKCCVKDGIIDGFSRLYAPGYDWVHIGVYGYQASRLREYLDMDRPASYDKSLEQTLWREPLACVEVEYDGIGVDRPGDIARVEERISNR